MPDIVANGVRLHFRLEGDPASPPVVLVHPLGADLGLWDKLVPLLTPWARVLRYDLRGHGGSETTTGEYALNALSDDLLALATQLAFDRFCAVGVSLGALTALDGAARAPQRVRSVVACSVAVSIPPPPGGWDARAAQVREHGMAPLGQPMVERMFSAAFRDSGDPAIESTRSALLGTDPAGYAAACAVLRDADVTSALQKVVQPVVVVAGESDVLTPSVAGQAMVERLAHGSLQVVPGGHFPPVECPIELARVVRGVSSVQ